MGAVAEGLGPSTPHPSSSHRGVRGARWLAGRLDRERVTHSGRTRRRLGAAGTVHTFRVGGGPVRVRNVHRAALDFEPYIKRLCSAANKGNLGDFERYPRASLHRRSHARVPAAFTCTGASSERSRARPGSCEAPPRAPDDLTRCKTTCSRFAPTSERLGTGSWDASFGRGAVIPAWARARARFGESERVQPTQYVRELPSQTTWSPDLSSAGLRVRRTRPLGGAKLDSSQMDEADPRSLTRTTCGRATSSSGSGTRRSASAEAPAPAA